MELMELGGSQNPQQTPLEKKNVPEGVGGCMGSVSLPAVSRACEGTEATQPSCATAQSGPGWVNNWVLGGRQVP